MQISKIENIHSNTCCNQKNTSSSFKGTASPEFVKYVNELRGDCLQIVPKRSAEFINNVCDNIINKAQRVMKNCFPQESVLSVDTTKSPTEDFIVYSNKVLYKYIPEDYNAYSIKKKGDSSPFFRLIGLHKAIISGYGFAGASVKDYVKAFYLTDYLKSSNMHNESFSKDCIPLFEFYYNKINRLKSETNADKHCLLKTQADYAKFLSDLKEIG
ncbi:hypothetical protein IJ596_03450 [bacterium]|nr:hypothetical protein [bacterium]